MRNINELIELIETEMPLDITDFRQWDELTYDEKCELLKYSQDFVNEMLIDFLYKDERQEVADYLRKIR